MSFDQIVDGINFGEGPRWHENRLWYSDFYQGRIFAVGEDGQREIMVEFADDRPSGLGWLPNGDLLVVSMTRRQLWRIGADGTQSLHADLSDIAEFHCNDMVVDDHIQFGEEGIEVRSHKRPSMPSSHTSHKQTRRACNHQSERRAAPHQCTLGGQFGITHLAVGMTSLGVLTAPFARVCTSAAS
ncbi:MAG: SMP-30/gluconolactonase/LRE family protein, partial [Acidobacteria bacterium]|nr:SMP-30/gluconolactonase/LRE family protein [Acidobacteriota bacterium]